jgi:hypothetical protein
MIIEHMRTFLALAVMVGCGGSSAAPDAEPDAAPTLDCRSYCGQIQSTCTGENAQYPSEAHCMAACASFPVGTSTVNDTSGHTLGCRIYHAGSPSRDQPATHCSHAGPGGDHLMATPPAACSGGDVCTSFCTLQFKACGSLDAPLPGNPKDASGNPLIQYRDMADCLTVCAGFDRTHPYRLTSAGNSLACRLLHATRAVLDLDNAKTECRYTGMVPLGPCAGMPTP